MSLINTFSGGSGGGTDYLPVYAAGGITNYTKEMLYGCTKIRNYMFTQDTDIVKIEIPEGVTEIGKNAFLSCTSLTSLNIPKSIISINDNVFNGCSNLVINGDFSQYTNLTNLGNNAFYNCNKLTKFIAPSSLSSDLFGISYCQNLTEVDISTSNVKSIASSAFYNDILLTTVKLNNLIDSIVYNSFNGCAKLTNIILPNKLKYIRGGYSFYNCSSLQTIDIPNTIIFMDSSSFGNCSALKTINVHYKTGSTPYKSNAPWGATNATINYIEDV